MDTIKPDLFPISTTRRKKLPMVKTEGEGGGGGGGEGNIDQPPYGTRKPAIQKHIIYIDNPPPIYNFFLNQTGHRYTPTPLLLQLELGRLHLALKATGWMEAWDMCGPLTNNIHIYIYIHRYIYIYIWLWIKKQVPEMEPW